MVTGKAWTQDEIKTICSVYATMLVMEQRGIKYNKAQARRNTLPDLDGRSAGSYEMKCCNISAALNDQGMQWIKGYKPLKGYQHALKPAIVEAIKQADLFFDEERYFLKPQEART